MILASYLIKVSVLMGVFALVYHIFLRKETFFKTNRFFLISTLGLSFILPLIEIPIHLSGNSSSLISDLASFPGIMNPENLSQPQDTAGFSFPAIYIFYLIGMLTMIVRSLFFAYQLSKIRYSNPSMRSGKFRLIMNDKIPSFSFFRWIFIGAKDEENIDQNIVLKHEIAHSKQWHSADLILVEIVQAILWFNPFIQLYKKYLQETHEFLADQEVLSSGADLRDYIQTILEEIMHNRSYKLASHFKSSTIKKRVIMATKNSSKKAGWKYLLVLPVLILGLVSFTSIPVNDNVLQDDNPPTIFPIKKADIKKISQDFGGAANGKDHPGIDFAANLGTPVMATADGVVKKAGEKGDYGNIVYLVHDDRFSTLYAHLSKVKVKDGQKVKKGEVIGLVGNTGKSTAPHLHYEVRVDGKQVNPKKFIK